MFQATKHLACFLKPLSTFIPTRSISMHMSKPAPIAIIGGGPCGLTLARLLTQSKIDYVIFERDVSSNVTTRFQGGTLDLSAEGGQSALQAAGLTSEFEKLARRLATTMLMQDFRGGHKLSAGEGNDRPEIDRLQLRGLLLGSIPAEKVRWNKTLRSIERVSVNGKRDWELRFEDGCVERGFRLVVGSDGAWSKTRELITLSKPKYSGKMFIEGRISHDNPQYAAALEMVGAGNSASIGEGLLLCIQQMSDRSYRVYMGVDAPQTFTRPGGDADVNDMPKARATMNKLFAGWAPHLRDFVAEAEGPWRPWPLFRMDEKLFLSDALKNEGPVDEKTWTRTPGVVLLGDAAHLATPNGEGVNCAMSDAKILFEEIIARVDGTGDYDAEADAAALEEAIVAYEAIMRPRAYDDIKDGILFEELMYSQDGAQRMQEMFMREVEQ